LSRLIVALDPHLQIGERARGHCTPKPGGGEEVTTYSVRMSSASSLRRPAGSSAEPCADSSASASVVTG
jgi:hypothetical protein